MNGIISAIPNNWKHIIMCETMIHDLICNFTNYIFREFDKSLVCAIKNEKTIQKLLYTIGMAFIQCLMHN